MSKKRAVVEDNKPARLAQLEAWLQALGFSPPRNTELYHLALVHSSYTYEHSESVLGSYERLEFLGDSVLKLVVSEILMERFAEYREGDLTKIRAVLVSDATLAEVSAEIGVKEHLVLGEGERRNKGLENVSNLACAFEALLGALYLDGKLAEAKSFLQTLLSNRITAIDADKMKDNFKAVLQEVSQRQGMGLPQYRTRKESGPSHRRTFIVEVLVREAIWGVGEGKSKKEAQQQAAKAALERLEPVERVDAPHDAAQHQRDG